MLVTSFPLHMIVIICFHSLYILKYRYRIEEGKVGEEEEEEEDWGRTNRDNISQAQTAHRPNPLKKTGRGYDRRGSDVKDLYKCLDLQPD